MATSDYTPQTIEIQLTKGYVAIVDEQDADLALFNWFASETRYSVYAATNVWGDGRYRIKKLHRMIMEKELNRCLLKTEIVDHVDTNTMNCARSNLRLCNTPQNAKNRKRNRGNKIGLKGVHIRDSGRFFAQIQVDGKKISLGTYDTAEQAHAAYCEAAKKYHGEYARFE